MEGFHKVILIGANPGPSRIRLACSNCQSNPSYDIQCILEQHSINT